MKTSIVVVALLFACGPPSDATPHRFAIHQARVESLMNDVFVWNGMYSLNTTPEERAIAGVQQKIRQESAVRADYEIALNAQRAKQQYLSRSFESISELRGAVAEATTLANAIADPELRAAAAAAVKCANDYLIASDQYRQVQNKKSAWVESVFMALRDGTEVPGDKDEVNGWNHLLKKAVDDAQRLSKEEEIAIARFKGVMARKIVDGKVAPGLDPEEHAAGETPPN